MTTLEQLELEAAQRRARLVVEDTPPQADERRRRQAVVALAVALFAGTFSARLAVDDPSALLANFYTVPIAILAIEFGLRGGLAAAALAFALVVAWGEIKSLDVGVLGYVSRLAVFVVVGGLVGRFAERLRADVVARRRAQRALSLYAGELEAANTRLAQSVLRLEAFAQIAREVGGETDLHRVLALILRHGREITHARALIVFLREGDELVLAAAGGEDAGAGADREAVRLPVAGSLPGRVLLGDEPRLLAPGAAERAERGGPAPAAVRGARVLPRRDLGVRAGGVPPAPASVSTTRISCRPSAPARRRRS